MFCVEDRAILCLDCDDPIHSANDLTAKHSRFLLVGAKLSAGLVDQAPPSPDDDCRGSGSDEPHDVAAICAPQAQGSCTAKSLAPDCSNSYGGGSSISDYLTNICPGWRVDDLLFDDAAFSAASVRADLATPNLISSPCSLLVYPQLDGVAVLGSRRPGATSTSRSRPWTPTSST